MGFAPTQNQNGGWQATRDYYMLRSTWENAATQSQFARGNSVTIADPSIPSTYSFLTVESKSAAYEDSDTVLVSVRYTGTPNAQYGSGDDGGISDYALPTYRLEARLVDLPISEHPKFKALSNANEKYLLGRMLKGDCTIGSSGTKATETTFFGDTAFIKDEDGNEITLVTADAVAFGEKIRDGITSYLYPTYVWMEITQGNSGITHAELSELGQIATPRGNPPTAGGARDWMLVSASQQQQGELYNTTLEWQLSERGGWDELLYSS